MAILRFTGKNAYLSNFYDTPVEYNGLTYPNSEAAFQAQKTADPDERVKFTNVTAAEAKKMGKKIALRDDWEDVKVEEMYKICKAKFSQNEEIKNALIATGEQDIIEGNDHYDTYWGVCNGVGANNLGRVLMRVRAELAGKKQIDVLSNINKVKDDIIQWIKDYFVENAYPEAKAIVGISGGKDSSVVAALCVEALGKDRVLGVLMPQGEQGDIDYSYKLVNALGIESVTINIEFPVYRMLVDIAKYVPLTDQATINTPARIRMTTLYAVAACVGGRVANTCNLSEDYVGYATKFGDNAGDFSPLSNLTATEVVALGDALGLPYELTHKTPIDGLCGKTDEENLGFTYKTLDEYLRGISVPEKEVVEKIERMHRANIHKLELMPKYTP